MAIDTLRRRTFLTLVVIGLISVAPVHAVSLYKWTDEDGRVHYSQTPPEQSAEQTEKMHVKDSNPYQTEKDTKKTDKTTDDSPTATEQNVRVIETRKENCAIAKRNLDTYKSSERIQQPDGTVITLSNEMRASKVKEMQAQVNAYCN